MKNLKRLLELEVSYNRACSAVERFNERNPLSPVDKMCRSEYVLMVSR
jgi:hypothetical protein